MITAEDIMTSNPRACSPLEDIREVAVMMRDEDTGIIPVTQDGGNSKLLGVITDRDIVIRVVAEGQDLQTAKAQDCMSSDVQTLPPDTPVEMIANLMEQQQVRRVPIVGENGNLVGIVSLADVVRNSSEDAKEALQEVSKPTGAQDQS